MKTVKRQDTHREKIFVIIRVSDKGLLYRKELKQIKFKNSNSKSGKTF